MSVFPTMDFHQQHRTSAYNNRDQIPAEKCKHKQQLSPMKSDIIKNRTSPAFSFSSSSVSPRQDFSFTDCGRTDGDLLLLSGNHRLEMAPADEIFFHGHLLPLHLLSHFHTSYSSPRSSTDCSTSFSLPINDGYLQDDDSSTADESSSSRSTANGNFNARSGKKIHSETSDMRGTDSKFIPFSMFGLSRQRRASGFQGVDDEQKRKFRFGLKRTFRKMTRPLLFFRRRKREQEDIELVAQKVASRGTEVLSAPASIRTSPKNSSLHVKRPTFSEAISDSTVEELQAAIQAAIAYCKKSIADEENDQS